MYQQVNSFNARALRLYIIGNPRSVIYQQSLMHARAKALTNSQTQEKKGLNASRAKTLHNVLAVGTAFCIPCDNSSVKLHIFLILTIFVVLK